jgi:hypothetical protein
MYITVKLTLEQGTKAQRGVDMYLYSFFNLDARWDGWSTPLPDRFTTGKDPVPTVQKAGCAPGPVWTGAENSIRSPDCPARCYSDIAYCTYIYIYTYVINVH